MDFNLLNLTFFFLVFFSLLSEFGSSTHISNGALEAHETIGRNLLQAKTPCTENFQQKNYTILTTNCKGPQYPPKACCNALKVFACPFADKINDLSTDCAATMFSYINLYGRYPPGLFANICREDKKGLVCEDAVPPASTATPPLAKQPAFIMLTSVFLVMLLSHLF